MEQPTSNSSPPFGSAHGRPGSVAIWILVPSLFLFVCWLVSVQSIRGHFGQSYLEPIDMISLIPGAIAGTLTYYGNRAAKSGSKPWSRELGNLALSLASYFS